MTDNLNSMPELIEVLMRVVNSNEEGQRDIRVELRVHSVSLSTDDGIEFVVELDRANLSLDLDGLEVVPKTRHGEPTKPNDVSIEHKLTNEKTRQAEISGSAEGTIGMQPSGSISTKASGSAGAKVTESLTGQQTHTLLRVKARGNLTWEVTEPLLEGGTKALDDTYLNDDVLCKVKALPGANMLAVKLAAYARKRDVRIAPKSKLSPFQFKSRNHEKMLGAVITKAMSFNDGNGGILTFSISEISLEDEKLH